MKQVIVYENQRGFLFKNGRFEKLLEPGKYIDNGERREIKIYRTDAAVDTAACPLDVLLTDADFAAQTVIAEVPEHCIALHYIDGILTGSVLTPGRYAFWKAGRNHEFRLIDVSSPDVPEDIPEYVFTRIPSSYYYKVQIAEYEKGRLFFNKRLVRILSAGTYYFWRCGVSVEVSCIDTRLTQMNITGQEMLTQDKVSLRVNFVCSYRVTDYVKILTEIDDYEEQFHVAAQLAMREYIGRNRLDDILEKKDEMAEYISGCLKAKEKELFVEISGAGIKDIILPGEIRDIMNTVLAAEKRAQAGVITRREEVASTRSLLNTARLMDENQTLYKLKELEYVERICENVGSINLNGSGDMLSQLTAILRGGSDGKTAV